VISVFESRLPLQKLYQDLFRASWVISRKLERQTDLKEIFW